MKTVSTKTVEGKFAVSAVALAVQGALLAMFVAPLPALAADATDPAATNATTTDTPATDVPATDAPATESPAADAAATEAPAAGAAATEAPAAGAPAKAAASTSAAGIDVSNEDVMALIYPTNFVELGVIGVTNNSSKFGEYNGLYDAGAYALGNFDVRGGDGYGLGEGTTRWELIGTDLGTTSRGLDASFMNQGQWSMGIGYDELRHYTTGGTYSTPYQGSMGGNTFTLPPAFGAISTQAAPGTRSLTGNQLSYFQTQDVYSERTNTSFRTGYNFNPQWNMKFDFNRLDQTGAKLTGASTDLFNAGPGGINYRAENIAILMTPTSYQTDTVNFGVNWVGEQSHLSMGYYGSYFHDDNNGLSWSNPFTATATPTGTNPGVPFPMDTMSTPPSNDFHQLNLSGGYNFTPATKLAGGLSYARNTQNDTYAGTYTTTPTTVTNSPASSLEGLVVTTHADLKLTHQATKALGLSAGVKYNERDNRTASGTYNFLDLGGAAQTVVNIPMSNKRYQLDLAGDYRLTAKQRLNVGYEYDHIKRWCNNDLANNTQAAGAPVGYYTTASCAQVPESGESKASIGYKLKATDTIDFNAGYVYSDRNADVNSSFYNPMQSRTTGFENFGYVAYFQASRTENLFKAGVNWQATERLGLGLNGRYAKDDYGSTLGVQDGKTMSANLDGTYTFSENNSLSAYATWQKRERDLLTAQGRNAVATPVNFWTNNLRDTDITVGLSGKQKGFFGGKLELNEDLTYSLAKSRYDTTQLYTPVVVGNVGSTPDIESELIQVRLTAGYQVTKPSKVILGYTYQHLNASDYYYNAYQYGSTPTSVLPTNQQAPQYTVNTIFVAYNYSFR